MTTASSIALQIGTVQDLRSHDLDYCQVFVNETWDSYRFYKDALQRGLGAPLGPIQLGLQASSILSDGMAPPGAHVLHIRMFPTNATRWQELRSRSSVGQEDYRDRKRDIAEKLIQKAESVVPGLASSVVVQDTCTPPTFERYTSATGGAWYDNIGRMDGPASRTPVSNLMLTGTNAVGGGGLPAAVAGGLQTAQALLRSRARSGRGPINRDRALGSRS